MKVALNVSLAVRNSNNIPDIFFRGTWHHWCGALRFGCSESEPKRRPEITSGPRWGIPWKIRLVHEMVCVSATLKTLVLVTLFTLLVGFFVLHAYTEVHCYFWNMVKWNSEPFHIQIGHEILQQPGKTKLEKMIHPSIWPRIYYLTLYSDIFSSASGALRHLEIAIAVNLRKSRIQRHSNEREGSSFWGSCYVGCGCG